MAFELLNGIRCITTLGGGFSRLHETKSGGVASYI